ncbi:MAG: DUF3631 domain-containing protein [Alistipes senegalensis]|nr:DUF3631 domain-containing protein [Oxalobacter formigenes]MCM1280351.1 DUF3631 domain-containing protein [Alistipes senegalensis]
MSSGPASIEASFQESAITNPEGKSAASTADHAYLKKKGIRPYGVRVHEGSLIVPVMRVDKFLSLQYIHPSGTKRFMPNGRTKGGYFIIGRPDQSNILCVAEGFATGSSIHEAAGYPVAIAFNAGNLKPVAQAMRERFQAMRLVICADDDYKTESNPGMSKAKEAAAAVGGVVAVPDFGNNRPDGATDFNDLHQAQGLDAVRQCIEAALSTGQAKQEEGNAFEKEIARLAALPPIKYAQERKPAAKTLGIGVSLLDSLIKAEQEKEQEQADSIFEEIEPWETPVNPDLLLQEITDTIRRFIVCQPETAQAAALWVAMTWFMDVVQVAPLAVITAPEKRCGKTQMLDVIGRMSRRPLPASNISTAALFRSIELWQPTLLIDEADAFLKDNEEMRGLLNAGHTRTSAHTIRTVGDDHTPQKFNLWGAKAISGIGHLADTLMDRAIILELRRKLDCEQVERIRHAEPDLFTNIQRKLCRFAEDCRESIRPARPDLPEALNDRAQDNWEPLLAIADTAGGQWPEIARVAALKLSGNHEATQSRGVELLADIKEVFEEKRITRIFTNKLVETLCEDSEKSWATYNRGKPLTPKQLSRRLAEYGIRSKSIRIDYDRAKGFERSQFDDAFARYIFSPDTPVEIVTSGQASIGAGFGVTIPQKVESCQKASNSDIVTNIAETTQPEMPLRHDSKSLQNQTVTPIVTLKARADAGCHDLSACHDSTEGAQKKKIIEGAL